ncbi:Mitochondrial inner membrane protein oxa1l [Coemansia sp. RSA 1813]|nr:Mitochondrial inner membrane protein oxa1l [Coemansia sp. RSA 1813]
MNQTRRFPTAYIATAQQSAAQVLAGLSVRQKLVAQKRMFHASSARGEEMLSQLDPTAMTEPMMKIGDLANHGLTTTLPTQLVEYCLEYAHVTTGLPWWATIMVVTVGIRTALFPLAVYSQRELVKTNNSKPEFDRLKQKLDKTQARGDTIMSIQMSNQVANFYKDRGIKPFRAMMGNLSIVPFMLLMFLALRDLATIPITHMSTGGLYWFVDLSQADPYFILPTLSCLGMMGSMELQSRLNSSMNSSPGMKLMMRSMGVLAIFFTYALPTNVFVFWITNNICSIIQPLVLHNRTFRKWANIGDTIKSTYVTKDASPTKMLMDRLMKRKKEKFVVRHKQSKK